jgi:hypothetical protein
MVIFAILMGLVFYVGFKIGKRYDSSIELGIIGLFIGCFIALFITLAVVNMTPGEQKYEELDRVELVALKNLGSAEGSLFLGSGRIESTPYYFFYYQLPDGGKKLGKLAAENATVYEEKRTDAYMARRTKQEVNKKSPILSWLLIPELFLHGTKISSYVIHVPEGTIVRGMSLDLKDIN